MSLETITKNRWRVCRICLKSATAEMASISDDCADMGILLEKIEECAGLRLIDSLELPAKICEKCCLLLRLAAKFRLLCQRSQEQLAELLHFPTVVNKEKSTKEQVNLSVITARHSKPPKVKKEVLVEPEEASDVGGALSEIQEDEETDETCNAVDRSEAVESSNCEFTDWHELVDCYEYLEDDSNQNCMSVEATTYEIVRLGESSNNSVDEQNYNIQNEDSVLEEEHSSNESSSKLRIINLKKHIKDESSNNTIIIKKRSNTYEQAVAPKLRKVSTKSTATEATTMHGKLQSARDFKLICNYCGNVYTELAKLNLHKKIHLQKKPHECEVCHKRFAQTPQLTRHMNSHTGNRPYKCKYCNSSFADPSTCIKHERIHTKERPYKCEYCDKSFSYSNVLKVHTMTHTGERPHQCSYCDKKFAQAHHMRTHELTHKAIVLGIEIDNMV